MTATQPPEIPEKRWTDWSVPAWVSVNARTPEEAQEEISKLLAEINPTIRERGAIIQQANDHQLPEES